MNTWKSIVTLISTFCFLGCATTASVRNAPLYLGEPRPFSADLARVLKAAQEAAAEAGLRVAETYLVDDKTWAIIAKTGLSLLSYGEIVRLVIEQKDSEVTTVRVHTKRKVATNITAPDDYAELILAKIENKLRRGER